MDDVTTMMQYEANKKSLVVAYILWWLLGIFGAHRFYLGQVGTAVAMLLITLCSFIFMIILIGFLTIFITFIWWIIDAFLIPGIVTQHNNALADRLSRNRYAPTPAAPPIAPA